MGSGISHSSRVATQCKAYCINQYAVRDSARLLFCDTRQVAYRTGMIVGPYVAQSVTALAESQIIGGAGKRRERKPRKGSPSQWDVIPRWP